MLEPRTLLAAAFAEFVDPHPADGNHFGEIVVPLSTGNVVVTSPYDDAGGTDAGAVYLFNGATGELISTLTGSHAGDRIGDDGVVELSNGNFVISSLSWDDGIHTDVGAVTWGHGVTGISGTVSPANSLVGTTDFDAVGNNGITVLTNGNYVVSSQSWDLGVTADVGAVTWGHGASGVSGPITNGNSLMGSTQGDAVGNNGVYALPNGNYVVSSPDWDFGSAVDAGAVTTGDGNMGTTGYVDFNFSHVGDKTNDRVSEGGITVLSNSNYVVQSPSWDNGGAVDAGAVTLLYGTGSAVGFVNSGSSLVGSTSQDRVGSGGVFEVANANFVVVSPQWDDSATINVGAATFGSGTTGVRGPITAANSLVGVSHGDQVGEGGITVLSNGNYLVRSQNWDDVLLADVGAVTWADGTTGATGPVTAANSLIGSTAGDKVGFYGVTELTNGNYLVISPYWDNGTVVDAGAVTFRNGSATISGVVGASNSLVGSRLNDQVGIGGVTPLTNGNYVVSSYLWDDGAKANVGAATWGNGTTGIAGTISAANSLVGESADDQVSSNGVTALTNGNYVVSSPLQDWYPDAGAATWGDGTVGITGIAGISNSIVGPLFFASNRDRISSGGILPLPSGNYLIASPHASFNSPGNGAVMWSDGTVPLSGNNISNTTALVGESEEDFVGETGTVTVLPNGNYVVLSPWWDYRGAPYSPAVDQGAVTFGHGTTGVTGEIEVTNGYPTIAGTDSVIGSVSHSGLQLPLVLDHINDTFIARFLTEGGGRVRVGSQTSGFADLPPRDITLSNVVTAVAENTSTTTRMKVADFKIEDDGIGEDFIYLGGTDADKFELFSSTNRTGELYLKAGVTLDHEAQEHFEITLAVSNVSKSFRLAVADVNEAPTISLQNTMTSLPENASTAAAVKVADLVVSDDALGIETLTLTGADAGRFQIVGTELRLKAGTSLNFEGQSSYAVTVNVDDTTVGSSPDASVNYTLYLTDVNEAPVVTPKQFLIGENSANGAFIGTIPANDVDAGQTRTYAITAGNANNAFALDPTSGVLTVYNSAALNFEMTTQINLTVTVTDNGNPAKSGSAPVTVFLRDMNDAPVVTAKQFLIGENSASNAFIGTIPATDQDSGQTKSYAIVAGNSSNAFAIDPATGTLTVNNSTALDFERMQQFDLTIRVADNGAQPAVGYGITTVFLRDVNDAPLVTAKDFLIGENSVNGAYVGKIAATEVDAGQTVTFAIVAGNSNNAFAIDPITGTLTVNNSAALNFEAKSQFDLTIRAIDNGSPAKAGTAVVRVFLRDVNEAPVVTAKQFLISENSVNGAFIGTIPATDQDAGQTKTYTIIGGNIGNAFAIDPATGTLTVNNSTALDFERMQQFDLTIRVADNGAQPAVGYGITTVFLRNVNDAPLVTAKDFLIGENSANGAYIGKIAATEVDAGQTVTFAIVAGNSNNAFAIDPITGTLTVNNSAALNFEAKSQFDLTVRATDNGSPAKAGTAVVRVFLRDVNEAPVVTAKQFLISENSVNGAFIGTIPATDQDAGQTKTYTIIGGNIGNAFAIDPATGTLTVNNSAALDFEIRSQFNLTIRVVDNGSPAQAGIANVTVFLRDVAGARSAVASTIKTKPLKVSGQRLYGDFLESLPAVNRLAKVRLGQK